MINKVLPIFDKSSNLVLKAKLLEIDEHKLIGKALDLDLSEKLKQLFQLHEERVNQNILSELERIEEEIQTYGLNLKLENKVYYLTDVQLMNGDDICFKFADEVPAELKT